MPKATKKPAAKPRHRRCLIVEVTPEIEQALGRLIVAQGRTVGLSWTKSAMVRSLIFEAAKKIPDSPLPGIDAGNTKA